jgi:TonB family protein
MSITTLISGAALTFSLFACAAGTMPMDRETTPTARVKLDFAVGATDTAAATFPGVVDPQLPSADRIAPRIHHVLGDTASAAVQLCVAPSGKVASVTLERSSEMPAFDRAMMNDIAGWQFAAMPGPDTVKSCERLTISYRPHD